MDVMVKERDNGRGMMKKTNCKTETAEFFVLKVQVFVHPGINPHLLIILTVRSRSYGLWLCYI